MGGCVSSSSRSNCSSGNGEKDPFPCLGIGVFRQNRIKKTFSDHHAAPQNLQLIPNRIIMNGKRRSSCIFTQQGCKGINQDAMIAWEVSSSTSFWFEYFNLEMVNVSWIWKKLDKQLLFVLLNSCFCVKFYLRLSQTQWINKNIHLYKWGSI